MASASAGVLAAPESARDLAPPPQSAVPDPKLVELGRTLFFDNRLSGDWSVSCASCHQPVSGWGDAQTLSRVYGAAEYSRESGVRHGYFRNTPTLLNVAHRRSLGWDGRYADVAVAIREMLSGALFMNADPMLVQERLKQAPGYVDMWRRAYGSKAEPFGPQLADAIAAFVTTLTSRNAPFDRYLQGEAGAITPEAKAGYELFGGKARCVRCHGGPLGSDDAFHRLGVAGNAGLATDPRLTISLLSYYAATATPNYMGLREDLGRYAVTHDEKDRGKFLTPGLRDLKYTAPYMHNGAMRTLEEVVEFHDRGGGPASELQPLLLTAGEKRALVAFLLSQSGDAVRVAVPVLPAFRASETRPPHRARLRNTAAAETSARRPLSAMPPAPVPANETQLAEKIALGKMLFWDARLSGDELMSCVSCHLPALVFNDGQRTSRGYPGTKHWRNTLSVVNAAYFDQLFRDGSAANLETQAAAAAQSAIEGNGSAVVMEMRLRLAPAYVRAFRAAFGSEWPQLDDAWRAIAAYERTLVTDPKRVPFDRFLAGESQALSPSAKRGYALYSGKARCIVCHDGPLASDGQFHATGVPELSADALDPLSQITTRWQHRVRGVPVSGVPAMADHGRYYATKKPDDAGKFRTPSLRELKYSAPYMHNGSFATLKEVVEFYKRGGGATPNKSSLLKPLRLGAREIDDLIAFLDALSMDTPLTADAPQLPELAPLP